MSVNPLSFLLASGLNAFDDVSAPAVDANPNPEPATPSIDVTVCPEEIEVVQAAQEAAEAEVAVVVAVQELAETEAQVDAATEVVANTAVVVASMESYKGSPMTKSDALALQQRVQQATKGQYHNVVGSLEAFGTDVSVDDALDAGLEGLGDFLKEARNKLADVTKVMRAKVAGFFKDAFVGFDKVAKRAEAVQRLAKNTNGESNASAIQLPLDTAWNLVKDGKVVTNLGKEIAELGKFAEAVMRTNNEAMCADRNKFIELVSPLASASYDDALAIAKKIADWRVPKPAFATKKLQTSSRTLDVFCSETIMGDQALFISMPAGDNKVGNLMDRLNALAAHWALSDVELSDVAKKPNKLDVAIDTLKPAEIVKITEAIDAILNDLKVYNKTLYSWEVANPELDRLMEVLYTVGWDEDRGAYEGSDDDGTVYISKLNMNLAYSVYYVNIMYGYFITYPTMKLAGKLLVILNRALEVCERSLATYNDNNLK